MATLRQQIATNVLTVTRFRDLLRIARENRPNDDLDMVRRAYEFSRTQMSAGIVNVLTVLNTENSLFTAEDTLVQVEYARLQALVDLFTALGGGWHLG